jgi:PAS domain S-box-containing protein
MTLNIFHWRSLKTRVTISTLTFFLVGIWALAFFSSYTLKNDMEQALGEQQFSTVSIIAAVINTGLDDRMRALEQVAARITPAILGNAPSVQKIIEQSPALGMMFNGGIIVTRIDSVAIADFPILGRVGINYSDRKHVAEALNGKSTIGNPVMGKMLKAPIVPIAVPIRDTKGKVIGTLSGMTDLGKPNFLDKITDNSYGKTGDYYLNSQQSRQIVTSSDKSRIMETLPAPGINPAIDRCIQGYEGALVLVNPRGVEQLASVKGVPVAGWYLAVAMPTEEAFAPIRALQQRMLLAAIFLTLLAGGLTWWILKRQLAPVFTTIKSLATLADTGQPLRPLPITRQDEIGELIGGFNHLLKTLGQRDGALKESEAKYRNLVENVSDVIYEVDSQGVVVYISPFVRDIMGYDPADVVGKNFIEFVYEDDRSLLIERFFDLSKGIEYPFEYRLISKSGDIRWVRTKTNPIVEGGSFKGTRGTLIDITERKKAEELIQASLREKDLLLNEIHHRVKNNLQVISGLLSLQAKASKNPDLIESFLKSQNRIQSMTLIHEKLYDSNDFTKIGLAGYVKHLSQDLFQSYKIHPEIIDMAIQTDGEVYVDINKAIPCGLILNELISNALKHAFPGDGPGKLQISIGETKEAEMEIVVRDNGVGLPDDVDILKPRSVGLHLVNGLVKNQLDGQIEVKRDNGTEFRITFPL